MKITPYSSSILSGSVPFLAACALGIWKIFFLSKPLSEPLSPVVVFSAIFLVFFLIVPNALAIAFPFFIGGFFAHSAYAAKKTGQGSMKMTPPLWGLLLGTIAFSVVYYPLSWRVWADFSHNADAGLIFYVLPGLAAGVGGFFFFVAVLIGFAVKNCEASDMTMTSALSRLEIGVSPRNLT